MIVALAGGVGGAKLAQGLYHALPPDDLAVIGNTADDFDHFGLRVSPDLDTVLYTLAGIANPETGWGIAGDSFHTLEALGRYGAERWFLIGDRDFATHIRRTELLHAGRSLTEVTASLARGLEVRAAILPMCDEPVATVVETPGGPLPFQDYFVRRRHQDPVRAVHFAGIERARVPAGVGAALRAAEAIVLCPSNPIVSLGPILAVPGLGRAVADRREHVVAVSPIIAGAAVRGPADRLMTELGHEASVVGVARLYAPYASTLVVDEADAALAGAVEAEGLRCAVAPTLMTGPPEAAALARAVLAA